MQISERPNHYGQICTSGLNCDLLTGGNRNLADFFTVDVDHLGAATVSWTEDNNGRNDTRVVNGRQISGNSVFYAGGSNIYSQPVNGTLGAWTTATYSGYFTASFMRWAQGTSNLISANRPTLFLTATNAVSPSNSLILAIDAAAAAGGGASSPGLLWTVTSSCSPLWKWKVIVSRLLVTSAICSPRSQLQSTAQPPASFNPSRSAMFPPYSRAIARA